MIYNSSMGYQTRDTWKKCKKALFGVGAIEKGTLLSPKLVSIPIHMLRDIPERTVVAGGESKAQAVQGLLRSGLITVLVTDEVAARKLL